MSAPGPEPPKLAPRVAAMREQAARRRETPPSSTVRARVAAAWERHPLRAFATHGRRLALLRQLSSLVRAGMGLPVALAEIARLSRGAERRRAEAVAAAIDADGLAAGLRDAGLDRATVELLAAAEETGTLDRTLPRLVARTEAAQAARWRIVSALTYPAFLVGVTLLLGPALSLGASLRAGAGTGDLPRLYLAGLARNLVDAALVALLLVVAPLLPALLGVERAWDRFVLHVPLVGRIRRDGYASRFLDVLAGAVGAGASAVRALELAVRATDSASITPRADEAANRIRGGASLVDAALPLALLDRPTLATLAVAERAGDLDTGPVRLAEDLSDRRARSIRALLLAVVAVVVALALLAAVRSIVESFAGTVQGVDEQLDQLLREGATPGPPPP